VVQHITSHSNDQIKAVQALRDKKRRRETGLFLAEGLRICTEAVEAGRLPRTIAFAADAEAHPLVAQLIAAVEGGGGTAIATTPDILHKLTGKDNPQSVLGVFKIWDTQLRNLDRFASPRWLVVEGLKDPGNLGTMLRTCDATGAGGLILLDASCDPFSVEAVRASMGAVFTQAIVQADGPAFLDWLRDGPGQLVGASLLTDTGYRDVRYAAPTFVFMGNEQSGLPADYAGACDVLVKMPMLGKADSLNVAVSAAVLLYEVLAQQGA